jgi:hypothetical protein
MTRVTEAYLDAPRGLILVTAALTEKTVHLVYEHHRGLSVRGHCEQCAYRLFSLADPLTHQRRRADAEERGTALVRDGLAD